MAAPTAAAALLGQTTQARTLAARGLERRPPVVVTHSVVQQVRQVRQVRQVPNAPPWRRVESPGTRRNPPPRPPHARS
ncbi:MAG TPA: hypothetical protein VI259_23055 [Gemmatimonadaceae bacterium]